MRKFLGVIALLMMAVSLLGAPALAAPAQDLSGDLSRAVQDLVGEGGAKGAVLSIVQNGEVVLCTGFGFADANNGFVADGQKTAFRIGSLSKTFVAVAAQLLAQRGALDMDADIAGYLEPDFPALDYPVTMRQLLTHTAGFEDMVTGMAVQNVSDTEPLPVSVRKYRPEQVFEPGKVISYSNYGIALAAYAVECITGQDFADFCRDEVFLPLSMTRTTFEHMHDVVYVSKPYLPDGSETLEPYMNLYPEGSAVSTAEDMANYIAWLLDPNDNRVLSAQSKQQILSRQFSMSEDLAGVGLSWSRKQQNGQIYYDKKGETLHFYSRIAVYPEADAGVFLSFNTYLPGDKIDAVMQRAADMLCGQAQYSGVSGGAALDIRGSYVNNWSGFTTPERILRYIVPGKMIRIGGSPDEGFSMNGEQLLLIGQELYASPMGVIKFLRQEGEIMLATEAAITYTRVPFWQQDFIQLAIPVLFAVLVLVGLVRELILLFRKRMDQSNPALLAASLFQLFSFAALCVFMFDGALNFCLLKYAVCIKVCGWILAAAAITGLVSVIYRKATRGVLRTIPVCWGLASMLFCAWMIFMNIL